MNRLDIRNDLVDLIKSEIDSKASLLNISTRYDIDNALIYSDDLSSYEQDSLNIFLHVEVEAYYSEAKYQDQDSFNFDSNIYIGEENAIKDLEKSLKDLKYKGVLPIKVEISPMPFADFLATDVDTTSLQEYVRYQMLENIKVTKDELQDSSKETLINSSEAKEAFSKISEAQMGSPAFQRRACQNILGGGVMSHTIELIGELPHKLTERMFMNNGSIESTVEFVTPKLMSALRALKEPYGFQKEHVENMRVRHQSGINAGTITASFAEWNKSVNLELQKYADEFSKLPAYNKPQYAAREAAVALGNLDYDKAITHLEYLAEVVNSGKYVWAASLYDKDGYQPEKDTPSREIEPSLGM